MAIKLRQGQIWKGKDEFFRIVHLERLEVKYKIMRDLKSGEGEHYNATKKDFCRLLKDCTLLSAKGPEIAEESIEPPPVEDVKEEAIEPPPAEVVTKEAIEPPPAREASETPMPSDDSGE